MPRGWELVSWGQVSELRYGKAVPKTCNCESHNVPVMGTSGVFGWTCKPLSTGPKVIVGRKGTLGVQLAKGDFWTVDTAFWLEESDALDPYWAYYRLLAIDFKNENSGSAVPSLTRDHFYSMRFDLPEIEEQRRIASVFRALDDLIAVNSQLMQLILSLSRAALSASVNPNTRRVSLDSIAEVNPSRAPRADDAEVIYLAIADVKDGTISWPSTITWSKAPAAARLLGQKGDVIWSRVRPNRRSHALLPAATSNIVISTGMVVLRPKGVSSAYLMAVCDSEAFSDRLTAVAGGTAYPTVDAVDFAGSQVPLLSDFEQTKFDATMTPLWEAFAALEEETRELSSTRSQLLPLLMSGRARVKDVA